MAITTFASVRLITPDVARLVAFYEQVTGAGATWATPDFAQLVTAVATLAIGSPRTVGMLPPDALRAGGSSAFLEIQVEDVDALAEKLDADVVLPPTTMPWGNRSLIVRDPDGNLVNVFATPH